MLWELVLRQGQQATTNSASESFRMSSSKLCVYCYCTLQRSSNQIRLLLITVLRYHFTIWHSLAGCYCAFPELKFQSSPTFEPKVDSTAQIALLFLRLWRDSPCREDSMYIEHFIRTKAFWSMVTFLLLSHFRFASTLQSRID